MTTVNLDFAARELRARALAKVGDLTTAGMLLQDIEVIRDLWMQLHPSPAPEILPTEAPPAEATNA
jgi:hypothetical protein